jgi:hypothetical protein
MTQEIESEFLGRLRSVPWSVRLQVNEARIRAAILAAWILSGVPAEKCARGCACGGAGLTVGCPLCGRVYGH